MIGEDVGGLTPFSFSRSKNRGNGKKPVPSSPRDLSSLETGSVPGNTVFTLHFQMAGAKVGQ